MIGSPLSKAGPARCVTAIACFAGWLIGCSGDSSAPVKMHNDAAADAGGSETGPEAGDSNDAGSSADTTVADAGDDGNANADGDGGTNAEAGDDSAGEASAPTGTMGGACYGNSTCNAGLGCVAAVCVPAAAPGAIGGACYGNNTCDPGLVCTAGVCVQGPPALTYCDGKTARALPYNVATDFGLLETLGPGVTDFAILSNPDCSEDGGAGFPAIPGRVDAAAPGDDGGVEASDDGGAEASTSSGADGGEDVAAAEASAEASTGAPGCYEFLYNPSCNCWAGVIFQSTPINMGPGVCIAPGARMVTFQARSSRANARIKFGAARAGVGQTEFYINITTAWQSYAVSLPAGEPYNAEPNTPGGVWNGFSVVLEPQDHMGGSYVLVRNIVWTM